jgi:hypothetical protein
MTNEPERGQGRATEEAHRRRRRGTESLGPDAKLPIPPEVKAMLDAKGLVPRWVNNTGNRMHRLTVSDDYDKVDGVDPVPVDTDKAGHPIMAHLLAKPREFIEEDRAKAEDRRKEVEASLFRNPDEVDRAAASANPNPASAQRYIAKESTQRRGNQVLDG